jgi:hypothetical protein
MAPKKQTAKKNAESTGNNDTDSKIQASCRRQRQKAMRMMVAASGDYTEALKMAESEMAKWMKECETAHFMWMNNDDNDEGAIEDQYKDARKSFKESQDKWNALVNWWHREGKADAEKDEPAEVMEAALNLKRKREDFGEGQARPREF